MTGAEPSLGSILRAAREAKGIDLARAQRETRIRLSYLIALEAGEYRDLPEPLYVRGFLRTYAHYLALDEVGVLDRYRSETGVTSVRSGSGAARHDAPVRAGVLLLTPTRLGVALLLIGVVALGSYLAYEVITFARTPELRITAPATDLANYGLTRITIRGQTAPNAQISMTGTPYASEVTADADGRFAADLELLPGSNVITVVAHDPLTNRDSAPAIRTITVVPLAPSPSTVPSAGAGY